MSNREIKFRAWAVENKKMYTKLYSLEVDSAGEFTEVYIWGDGDDCPTSIGCTHEKCNLKGMYGTAILMQYTGLKDKNGVEIYEGDIVGCKQQGRIKKGIVEWKDGMWNWTYDTKSGNTTWLFGAIEKWKPEILGNIYENNNLLEEKK